MALGRISGPLLKADLLREGVDLAVETNLIYFEVNTHASDVALGNPLTGRVGIKTDTPTYDLEVNGTLKASVYRMDELNIGNGVITGNVVVTDGSFKTLIGDLTLQAEPVTGLVIIDSNAKIIGDLEVTGDITLDNVLIGGLTTGRVVLSGTDGQVVDNANLTFDGTKLTVTGNQDITGNLKVDGNITLGGTINVGNANDDLVVFNGEIGSDFIPDITDTYDIGSSSKRWDNGYYKVGYLGNISVGTNTIQASNTNGGITLSPNGSGTVEIAGTAALRIPAGSESNKTEFTAATGQIRLNTSTSQFEGYTGTNWSSLGGVRSVDNLTFITAELTPGASDDTIRFYTDGTLRGSVDINGIAVNDAKTIRFFDQDSSASVSIKSPNVVTGSYTINLPASQPSTATVLSNDGAGNTTWTSPDTFGGSRVYVSKSKGLDTNDGVNLPVLTLKKALQIAAGMTKPVTVFVASGDYYIDNPVIVPDSVSIIGDSLRSVVIRPLNANKDMLRVRNGAYINNVTFRDGLNISGVPTYTFSWALTFDDPFDVSVDRTGYTGLASTRPLITLSPYIQNCSIISFLGASGVWVDGSKVLSPNVPANNIEAENPIDLTDGIPEQGKSMVGNAFTMLSFGGTGWLITNDAYAQLVSCFQIFMLNGTYTQSGGYISITNSATNFGLYALRSSGYSPNSFVFDRGTVAATGTSGGGITLTSIGTKRAPVSQYVIRIKNAITDLDITSNFKEASIEKSFNAATAVNATTNEITIINHGFTNTQAVYYSSNGNADILGLLNNGIYYVQLVNSDRFVLFNDNSLSFPVDIQAVGSGTHKIIANDEEFFVGDTISSHSSYQELTLPAGPTYAFTTGQTLLGLTAGVTNTAFVYSWNPTTRKLIVSIELTVIEGNLQRIFFDATSTIFEVGGSTVSYDVDTATQINNVYFTSQFRVTSTISGNQLLDSGNTLLQNINFHRPSIVNSSAHTWEFAGSGTDYNALPQNGGVGRGTEYEQYSELPGRVYSSGTNELGDFKVGDFITAENKSGNITFATQVTIGELSILRLSLSDVEVSQFSTDPGLGDNEPGGASNSRISVQRAIRTFIANRLGNVLDKDVSTNAVPGAVVQLNSQGQINQDLLPPARGVTTYQVSGWGNRIFLANQIPAIEVISGDNASESYTQRALTISSAITWDEYDVITQVGTTGYGIVKQDYVAATEIILVNTTGTWNTTNNLIRNGTTLVGTTISIVGEQVNIVDNYFLNRDTTSQYLILVPNVLYNFTGITTVTGANSAAQGTITSGPIYGVAYQLDTTALFGGSGYTPAIGTLAYLNVPLTNVSGTGINATANIVVTNGAVSSIELVTGGTGYVVGNSLSASSSNIGGTGSGFFVPVLRADTRLYVDLLGNFIKFSGSIAAPEYIEDADADVITIANLAAVSQKNFDGRDVSVGGAVNYALSTIVITSHGYSDGDPLIYANGGNANIGNLTNGATYRVKVIDPDNFEIYNNYGFTSGSKILFGTSSSGTHNFRLFTVGTTNSIIYAPAHGLIAAQPVRFSAAVPPGGLADNAYYFVGSATVNSFTLHTNRADAAASINGITVLPVTLSSTGSGSASFITQNIQVIGTLNTSSTLLENWGQIAQSTIDASNIVSGVIGPTRLAGIGSATNKTFLRGDSSWEFAVQNIRTATASPLSITGDFFTNTSINYYYNALTFDIARADEAGGDPTYTSLGVAAFNKSQFNVNASGQATIKNGVVDAGTLDGQDGTYYTNPANIVGTVPILKGGTGLTTVTRGDILYSGSTGSLTQLAIGANKSTLTSNGTIPVWTTSPTFGGNLTVDGNVTLGDTASDLITINGSFVNGTRLKTTSTTANTFSLAAYDVDGAAYTDLITLTASNTPTLAILSTGTGSINNMTIGGTTRAAGSFTTLDANSTVGLSPANATVTISPTGSGSVIISPATLGSINNVSVGATTRSTGAFTTLAANNSVTFTANTTSTSPTTGTLVVTGGVGIGENLTIGGNLTVNGTTITFNSATLSVDDKNIELGAVVAISNVSGTIASTATTTTITGVSSTSGMIPGQVLTRVSGTGAFGGVTTITSVDSATQITITSATANTAGAIVFNVGGATDLTANGGGITLKGTTDKTFTYDNTSTRWQSNISLGVNGSVTVGTGSAAGTITSQGAQNLVLNTNAGTNSGVITINQGANANIELAPNGTGDVLLTADTVRVGDAGVEAVITSNSTGNLKLQTGSTNTGSITITQGDNGNIVLAPHGTGDVYLDADTIRVGDSAAEAVITSNSTGNLKLQTGSTNTGSITITQGDNANIVIAPHGTGDVQVDADTLRVGDAAAAATITSNGAGALTVTTGGAANLLLNTNSGTNSGSITITQGANANIEIAPNGTGDVLLTADTVRVGDAGVEAIITSNGTGNLKLQAGSTNTGSITIAQGDNANIVIAPHGTGDVQVDADTLRVGDANADATITTNGTGDLTLSTNAGTNSGTFKIFDGVNGNVDITANGTGNVNIVSNTINLGTSTSAATTVKVGGAFTGNILKIAGTAAGTINLTTDVTTGAVSVFPSLTTATMTIGSAAAGTVAIAFNKASTSTTTGALTVAGGVGINGALNALTKSFVIPHPTKPGKLLRHGSLEGPEFGVYVRGRCSGNVIELPEYWTGLVDEETITVDLTPIGKHQKLYVEKIEGNKVYIANDAVFGKGINCFYTVWGERKDVDKLDVEVDE